jgi:hypothetical protein
MAVVAVTALFVVVVMLYRLCCVLTLHPPAGASVPRS